MVTMSLGERIRSVREGDGLTQENFAAALEVTPATINRYENGHRVPDADFMNRLVHKFGCDPGWLLTGEDQFKAVGPRIRHYRMTLRFTQEEFANLTGISQEALLATENQNATPTNDIITAIIHKTDINPQWLFSEKLPMRRDNHLTGEGRPFQKFGKEDVDVELMWKVIEVMHSVTVGTAQNLSDDKKGIFQKLLYDDALQKDRQIDERYAALLSRLIYCDVCEEKKSKALWQEKWRIKAEPGIDLEEVAIFVKTPQGLKCPKEGRPREFITDSVPVLVPCTAYYRKLVDEGSLILVETTQGEAPTLEGTVATGNQITQTVSGKGHKVAGRDIVEERAEAKK